MREELKFVGASLSNDQAYGKATGAITYCSDMTAPGMLVIRLKLSTIAHGWIDEIDIEEALALPGVRAVYYWGNTPDRKYDRGRVASYEEAPNQERLFDRHVRFYGERVAAVVAESEEIAAEACRRIRVSYREIPAMLTMEEASREGAEKIHEEGNVYEAPEAGWGDFENCQAEYCQKTQVALGRMTHLSMETHSCRALWDKSSGKLTVWTGCQTVFGIRSTLGDFLGLPYSKIHVIKTAMGGSFGCKQETLVEPLTAWAACDLKADVRLVYTREEQIIHTMLKHNLEGVIESKIHPDGKIEGVRVSVMLDAGAYQTISPSYLRTIGGKLGKVYRIPNITYGGKSICTNTAVNGSFRSWGSSEEAALLETHWNQVCADRGWDPVEFRLKNVLNPYEQDGMHGVTIGNARLRDVLTAGRERFRWEERKQACLEKNKAQGRYRYGVGVAMGSHTSSFYPYIADVATATARLQEDGSLTLHIAIHDHGCGTVMAMKKIAAEVMELDLEQIQLAEADTEHCMYDYGCYGSRTTYVLGNAVKKCCEKLKEKAKHVAAYQLQCSASVLRYQDGRFYPEPEPERSVSLREISDYALGTLGEDIYTAYTHNSVENPGVACAHFAEVSVDTFTGSVKVEHCLSVHDIGRAINPDLCRGQVGSGIQQGIGIALSEEIKLDPKTGEVLVSNLKNYEVTNACDMPDYDVLFLEEPDHEGPFGAKSIGEVVLVPVAPALVAAVNQALGTRLYRMPLTPAVILDAIEGGHDEN
ncbi:molybdopterin-dependent oxidoreductase [Cuneatibacter sp. NSJ-177]|uniref:xanthine dehydrogenase family protein molybdopterin-binding subunit n=1 Tax=Cuneatibacter sp. NSJ-177 TaxID=2931401 RepID=UPI001FCFC53A|nr:molybdopterin cofactor-binding domain-containing protein [Cuneatibacter sp. NSJ-177]MCJ7837182.1 molybdopterin-dependent oxidoreductase [Cuneatibacter sp. NSJ-177]